MPKPQSKNEKRLADIRAERERADAEERAKLERNDDADGFVGSAVTPPPKITAKTPSATATTPKSRTASTRIETGRYSVHMRQNVHVQAANYAGVIEGITVSEFIERAVTRELTRVKAVQKIKDYWSSSEHVG
jgi:hypothetical protein